ncbi:ankyrin repeat domain-containing protein [Chryseobacterium sp. CT-SW4]|uniref:ankyrin repeat domain-containing protein n=1 Tax=Chryseobacterium sp. SW-1 TaxID=3157343 RepID=UPI003B01143D
MKKIISASFILGISIFADLLSAQEITKDQMKAFQSDNVDVFKSAFSKNDFNKCLTVKENSYNLLAYSVKYERKNVFNYLLSNNVNVNQICDNQSPLMVAARYGKADMAKTLIQKGADKNLKNENGETAKDFAVKYGNPSLAAILK